MDFSTVCRMCLKTTTLNPIFSNPYDYKNHSNAVFTVTGIKVTPDDGLPQQVCDPCVNFVNESLIFRKKCKQVELQLIKQKTENDLATFNVVDESSPNSNNLASNKECVKRKSLTKSVEGNNDKLTSETNMKMEGLDLKYDEMEDIKLEYIHYDDDDDNKPLKYLVGTDSENSNDTKCSTVYLKVEDEVQPYLNVKLAEDCDKKLNLESKEIDFLEIPFEIDLSADPSKNRVNCKICRKSLSIRSVDAHMESRHPGKDGRRVKCDLCDKSLLRDKLNRHMMISHRVGYQETDCFRCGYCRTVFEKKDLLISHVVSCTSKKKKRKSSEIHREMVECDECHKTMQKASLRMHKAIKHAGLGPVCEHCGIRFGNKFRLTEHCRAKHGYDKFKCKYCDFQSAGVMAMRNHERRHRGEKPFVCESCGAKFHAAYLLAQHKQSHRTERLLKCDMCPATFKANNSLHMHKITCHSGALYKCTMCTRTYNCRHYVVKHLRHFHEYHGRVGQLDKVQKVKEDSLVNTD